MISYSACQIHQQISFYICRSLTTMQRTSAAIIKLFTRKLKNNWKIYQRSMVRLVKNTQHFLREYVPPPPPHLPEL